VRPFARASPAGKERSGVFLFRRPRESVPGGRLTDGGFPSAAQLIHRTHRVRRSPASGAGSPHAWKYGYSP